MFFPLRRVASTTVRQLSLPLILRLSISSLFFILFSTASAEAVITLRVEQAGSDVLITGSGTANLTALTLYSTETSFQNVLTDVQIFAGPSPFAAGKVDLYKGILSGPPSISSNSSIVEEPDPMASSGDLFGVQADLYQLVVPQNYVSNAPLSGVSIIRDVSISGLGLTPGLATWTWGSTANGTFDSINLEVVPGPLPLAGAATTFVWCRKLRRRALHGQSM